MKSNKRSRSDERPFRHIREIISYAVGAKSKIVKKKSQLVNQGMKTFLRKIDGV